VCSGKRSFIGPNGEGRILRLVLRRAPEKEGMLKKVPVAR
jgi:hypothetical protein